MREQMHRAAEQARTQSLQKRRDVRQLEQKIQTLERRLEQLEQRRDEMDERAEGLMEKAEALASTEGDSTEQVLTLERQAREFEDQARYRAFLAESPDHAKAPIARYGLAVCLFRTGQYQDAAAEMKAVRSLPGFP